MTEKTEAFEVHPMRGHSRGEWYGTLDDIVESPESAEYWAVFGVTHRGNKHCLGEFPTEHEAQAAVRGLMFFPPPDIGVVGSIPGGGVVVGYTNSTCQPRKIVQFEVSKGEIDGSMLELFALCDDGSVWHRGVGIGDNRGFVDDTWTEISMNGIEK